MIVNKERNSGIQSLRALAAILVLIQHVIYLTLEHYNKDVTASLKGALGSTGVGIFFVISGFVITKSLRQGSWFLVYRALRIYPAFWFVAFISFLGMKHVEPTISSLLLIPTKEFNASYRIPYWTLVYEAFFYVMLYGISLFNLSKQSFLYAMITWLCVIVLANIYIDINYPVPHTKIILSSINIFFIFGVLIALDFERYSNIPQYHLVILSIICYQMLGITNATLYHTFQALYCSSIFLIFTKLKPHKFFVMLGDSSYGLYLIHNAVILGTIKICTLYKPTIRIYAVYIIALIISGVIGTAYGYCEYKVYQKIVVWIKRKRGLNT